MINSLPTAIGGYFELELPTGTDFLYPEALRFQSARAAFHALLNAGKPSRVWAPKYICDAMLAPLTASGIEVVFYDIDQCLGVSESVGLAPEDWLLYVNYFGVCDEQEKKLLKRFNPSQLILDHAQAFFTPPKDCLATIYSPRKFFGLPDGGLLSASFAVTAPDQTDNGSVARCSHLLKRLDSLPEAGYADFRAAEESLLDTGPRKMSNLSERLLNGIDYNSARQRRNANFQFLHQHLQHLNDLEIDPDQTDGPLCYPLLIDNPGLRKRLIAERIFIPSYWPEATTRVQAKSMEHSIIRHCLPLPCDQRYGPENLIRMIHLIAS
jgi:hypothetical protein